MTDELARMLKAHAQQLSSRWADRVGASAAVVEREFARVLAELTSAVRGAAGEPSAQSTDAGHAEQGSVQPRDYATLADLIFDAIEESGVVLSNGATRALTRALLRAAAGAPERLARARAASGVGACELDLADHSVECDRGARELLGVAGASLTRAALLEALPFDADREKLAEAIDNAALGPEGGSCRLEFRTGGKGGRPLSWVECRGEVNSDAEGRPLRLTCLLFDISARKAAEDQAKTKNGWLNLLLDNIKDYAVILQDIDRVIVEWQGGAAAITGYSPEEAVGQSADFLFTTAERLAAIPEKEMATALRDGRAEDTRWHLRKDNSRFFADGVMTPLYDSQGNLNGFGKVFRDATAQKQAEDALRLSDERLHFALRAGRMGTWDLDLITNELTASETCKANYGRGPNDPFTYEDLIASVYEEEREAWLRKFDATIASCSDLDLEYRVRWPDQSIHWVHVRASCSDDGGHAIALSGVSTSIDERKAIEDELRTADRRKDEFLSTASHELRTPLNAILGWASMLRAGRLDPDAARRAAETIERNARAQVQLIEDILDGSRIITGKLRLEIGPLDMTELVRAAVDAIRPAADAKNIGLTVNIDPAAARVVGDPDRLQQVVWNLGTNAIKFTPRGGAVEVRLQRTDGGVELRVKDTGQGIAPDFLPYVFERFRQADGSTTRRYGGLGLGLALVRHLVDAHGGTVHAESEGEGRGAAFVVMLPIPGGHTRADEIPERPVTLDGDLTLDGVTALVVDDEADARELVASVLRLSGADVRTTSNAEDALAEIERARPMIVLSDIAMPEMDGYAFMTRVRRHNDRASLPAIALTAYTREEDRRLALSAGFQLHVAKPVEPMSLVRAVAHLVAPLRAANP